VLVAGLLAPAIENRRPVGRVGNPSYRAAVYGAMVVISASGPGTHGKRFHHEETKSTKKIWENLRALRFFVVKSFSAC
jgi:hypothetical protein